MSDENQTSTLTQPDRADFEGRRAFGRAARAAAPRSSHAGWAPPEDRTDPVSLLEEQATTRVTDLVPIRHGRMMVSPFTFYRGAALLMAADLARTPSSGLIVQLCGDAHLSNFGLFASAERNLVFDINDFDETHPGPFEWDVKRLAASFEIAGRHLGFTDDERRDAVLAATRGYRERMQRAAESGVLEAWYDHLDAATMQNWLESLQAEALAGKRQLKAFNAVVAKARTRDSLQAFSKLVSNEDGRMRIIADPPLIVPVEDLFPDGIGAQETEEGMRDILAAYRQTLQLPRHPLDEFTYVHMARKVVGVGSVGTRAWIVLMRGRDDADPLFLQAKEAQASVLERFLEPCAYENQGERVVAASASCRARATSSSGGSGCAARAASSATSTCDSCAIGRARSKPTRPCRGECRCTRACAARRSPARTPARATAWRSRRTSAGPTRSTRRSPSSPPTTPTRTTPTTARSPQRSRAGGSRRCRGTEKALPRRLYSRMGKVNSTIRPTSAIVPASASTMRDASSEMPRCAIAARNSTSANSTVMSE